MKKLKVKPTTKKVLAKKPEPKKPQRKSNSFYTASERAGVDALALAHQIQGIGKQHELLKSISEISGCPIHMIPEGWTHSIEILEEVLEHLENI